MTKKYLPKKSDNISEWYTKVIQMADLADYGPAKGTIIFKPYGYAIWELIQTELDKLIKQRGVENAYFPLFIPESLLEKEKTHVKGFAPELAVVTIGGGEELEEKLVVRPTSETIMHNSYAKWIQSWRDLPVMMNQWGNAVRWEKRTMPFLRNSEFLWQEGHTAHADHNEAKATQQWAMSVYEQVYKEFFALFGYVGYKSKSERFAGAETSLTYESLMPSGKALQSATSHDLGQNFAKAFRVVYQNQSGQEEYVWQTSWGLSTRSLGGLILMHGDDNGLRLPPKLAPFQAVVLPVRPQPEVLGYTGEILNLLKAGDIRARQDVRDDETIGFKINKWEVRGVPLRLEIGDREIAADTVTVVRRDTGEKFTVRKSELIDQTRIALQDIQNRLYSESRDFTESHTRTVHDYDEFKRLLHEHKGFIKVHWLENSTAEKQIQAETTATSRCRLPNPVEGRCFMTGKPTNTEWLFAQAY